MPHALAEALRLVASDRAEGRVFGHDHVAIAVRVSHQPDLCHAFNPDQESGLERSHGSGQMLRTGCHG